MRERQTLKTLIDDGIVATTLRKGSSARHAITALQTVLHWLGFDRQLKWERFGADGDYGASTVAAVAAFARRNGSTANGERLTSSLAAKLLRLYDLLEELKQLAGDVDKNRVGRYYKEGGRDRIRIASLQTLLHELGFGRQLNWKQFGADGDYGGSTTAAVAACAARFGIDGDGTALPVDLATLIVDEISPLLGDTWHAPSHRATPAPGSLSVKSVIGTGNRQYLEVSDGNRTKRFGKHSQGLYTTGNQKPAAFMATLSDELRALEVTASETNVMIAVAENEGNLDAINTWDNAFLSFGLFQWTAGTDGAKGELPALLGRIKSEDRDLFDKYCGQHGLDVVELTRDGVRGYFSLRGAAIKTPADKARLRQAPWAFYFWLAGQDPAVQAMEIKHALSRLDQFYNTDRYKVGTHRVSDLVTSEYGVGLILDNHVNRPAWVRLCLAKALDETGMRSPSRWGTDEERTLIKAYLDVRETFRVSRTPPMTDAKKRAGVTKKYLNNGTISDRRGSFKRSAS